MKVHFFSHRFGRALCATPHDVTFDHVSNVTCGNCLRSLRVLARGWTVAA